MLSDAVIRKDSRERLKGKAPGDVGIVFERLKYTFAKFDNMSHDGGIVCDGQRGVELAIYCQFLLTT